MEKFRVLSDLHLDVNKAYPLALKDTSIFTVICGDTSGTPRKSISWIKKNCPYGVGVSGNHLPYNTQGNTVQELREELAAAFPADSSFTYLDCETGTFTKEVDGILFVGSCMYTDMHITHERWNPNGDIYVNMKCSEYNINDYRHGIKSVTHHVGKDNAAKTTMITARDYIGWFNNAYSKIEEVLNDNEQRQHPKDVVLVTHHNLVVDFLKHNGYIENADYIFRQKHFNWASYASDMEKWIKRHASVKCYCCGHIHDVYEEWRSFYIDRDDNSKCLVVNNARGYVSSFHDMFFNPCKYVNVKTWTVEEDPIDKKTEERRKKMLDESIANLAWLI